MEEFGLNEGSQGLENNAKKDSRVEEGDDERVDKEEATEFRGIAARMNFLSQHSPDLQYPVKDCSKEMSNLRVGDWKKAEIIARYLVGKTSVIWTDDWQDGVDQWYTA